VQPRPIRLEPGARRDRIAGADGAVEGMEGGAVVHVPQMRDLMRDGGDAHLRRGEDQAPAVADRAIGGATAPAAAGVADADRADGEAVGGGDRQRLLGQHRFRPRPQPARDPIRDMILRATDAEAVAVERHAAGTVRLPVNANRAALQRHGRAG